MKELPLLCWKMGLETVGVYLDLNSFGKGLKGVCLISTEAHVIGANYIPTKEGAILLKQAAPAVSPGGLLSSASRTKKIY